MSGLRKYWQRHPIQVRLMAIVFLITLPIAFPLLALVMADWRGIARDFAEQYHDAWGLLVRGR